MKGFFVSILMMAVLVLILILGVEAFAGGSKVMVNDKMGISITVPEQAPEFLRWDGMIVAGEKLKNGNVLLLSRFQSPDKQTIVVAVFGVVKDRLHLLAFAAFYEVRGIDGKVDAYEDLGFVREGKFTGVFTQVEEATSLEVFKIRLKSPAEL